MTTDTLTLTEFLLARIDEDEAEAQSASVGPWDARAWPPTAQRGWAVEAGMWLVADPQMDADAHHIARWDPVRVIAECEAKRAIVERFSATTPKSSNGVIGWRYEDTTILSVLAAVYADHPNYLQEWGQ